MINETRVFLLLFQYHVCQARCHLKGFMSHLEMQILELVEPLLIPITLIHHVRHLFQEYLKSTEDVYIK